MSKYSFTINKPEQFDLRRILRENECAEAILITLGSTAVLGLSAEFLRQFGCDAQIVEWQLSPDFGFDWVSITPQSELVCDDRDVFASCRFRFVSFDVGEIDEAVQDLRSAREYIANKPKPMKITVKQL